MPSSTEPTAAEKAAAEALADTVNGHERGVGNVEVWTPTDFADEARSVVAAVRAPLYREVAEVLDKLAGIAPLHTLDGLIYATNHLAEMAAHQSEESTDV